MRFVAIARDYVLPVFVAAAIGATPEPAFPENITLVNMKVLDPPGREYLLGERLVINVDKKQLESLGGSSKLHARVVRGSKEKLLQIMQLYPDGDCMFIPSRLYDVAEYNGGLAMNVTFNVGWLAFNETLAADETFLVFFEQRRNDIVTENLLLFKRDVERYLQKAYFFVIRAEKMPPSEIERWKPYSVPGSSLPSKPCLGLVVTAEGSFQLTSGGQCKSEG